LIRFAFRVVFWLTIVIIFLPADPERGVEAPRVTFFQAVSAVQATVADLSRFCDRNPDVCHTGSSAAQVVAGKAAYGVRQLQDYLDGDDPIPADTLTPDDVEAPWAGEGDGSEA